MDIQLNHGRTLVVSSMVSHSGLLFNQCWAVFNFYGEPLVLILKNKLELF